MKVLIVGAGPAGLTTAVELTRRGVVSDVIDLRESGSGLSRAVGILPASLDILRPSGVTGKLLAEGMKFRQVRIYRHSSLALALPLNSPLKKASLTWFHATAKHIAAKAVSPSSETMRTI